MKKILQAGICFFICLSLVGCGQTKEEQIKEFDTIGRWGNLVLNISYEIPVVSQESMARGANTFTYLNGHMFSYTSNWKIYVETLLEGTANLESLPVQITQEKQSEKYKTLNSKINNLYIEEIEKTEKREVDGIDTVYFEGVPISTDLMSGGAMKMKPIGYSFMYEGRPICIYGEVKEGSQSTTEADLNDYLKYIISTIEPYKGESFVELDAMAMWDESDYLNDKSFPLPNTNDFSMEYDYTIFHHDTHVANGIFGLYAPLKSYWKEVGDRYHLSDENLKLEEIFDTVNAEDNYDIIASSKEGYELFSEPQAFTINNIPMMRYSGANKNILPASSEDKTVYPYGRYFVVYTFQYEGSSFYFQYEIGLRMSEVKKDVAWKLVQNLADLNADTIIRTIMTKEQVSNARAYFDSKEGER